MLANASDLTEANVLARTILAARLAELKKHLPRISSALLETWKFQRGETADARKKDSHSRGIH